jgi:hypothetical protein
VPHHPPFVDRHLDTGAELLARRRPLEKRRCSTSHTRRIPTKIVDKY